MIAYHYGPTRLATQPNMLKHNTPYTKTHLKNAQHINMHPNMVYNIRSCNISDCIVPDCILPDFIPFLVTDLPSVLWILISYFQSIDHEFHFGRICLLRSECICLGVNNLDLLTLFSNYWNISVVVKIWK